MTKSSTNQPIGVLPEIDPRNPSLFLRALVRIVSSGRLRRGYGRAVQWLPARVWGGEVVLADTTLGRMAVPLTDPSGFSLLFSGCLRNELAESKLLARLAPRCRAFFDVGAHYGWYARLVSQLQPSCTVVAIEPDPASAEVLRYNLREFANATIVEYAVGAHEGVANLWRAPSRDLSSTVRPTGKPMEVRSTTLDELCGQFDIATVDLVKCDVEGGEAEVLRGARSLLASKNPPIWMFEVFEDFACEAGVDITADILEVFRAADPSGTFFSARDDGGADPLYDIRERGSNNVLWVPGSRLERFLAAVNE